MCEKSLVFGKKGSVESKKWSLLKIEVLLMLLSMIGGLCIMYYLSYGIVEDNILHKLFIDGQFYGVKIVTVDDVGNNLDILSKLIGMPQWSLVVNFLTLTFIATFTTFLVYTILSNVFIGYFSCSYSDFGLLSLIFIVIITMGIFSYNSVYNYNVDLGLKRVEKEIAKRDYNSQLLKIEERYLESDMSEDGYVISSYKVHKDTFIDYLRKEGRFIDAETNLIEEFPTINFNTDIMEFSHLSGNYLVYGK